MGAYENGSFHFEIVGPQLSADALDLIWNSRAEDTYTVYSSDDLSNWKEEEVVPSQGDQTSWQDPDTTPSRRYYRVGIQ
jgi:hypothetical protein